MLERRRSTVRTLRYSRSASQGGRARRFSSRCPSGRAASTWSGPALTIALAGAMQAWGGCRAGHLRLVQPRRLGACLLSRLLFSIWDG